MKSDFTEESTQAEELLEVLGEIRDGLLKPPAAPVVNVEAAKAPNINVAAPIINIPETKPPAKTGFTITVTSRDSAGLIKSISVMPN